MGRAQGGIIVGVRCEIKIEGVEVCEESIATVKVKLGRETWIIEVYINGDLESNWKRMREWIDRTGEERIILGGDFNARTAERGGRLGEENERGWNRRKEVEGQKGEQGRIEAVKIAGRDRAGYLEWECRGRSGRRIYVRRGAGCSVIDYVIGEEEDVRKLRRMIGDRIESDYYPIIVKLREKRERRGGRGGRKERGRGVRG